MSDPTFKPIQMKAAAVPGGATLQVGSVPVRLTKGTQLSMWVFQDSGSNVTLAGSITAVRVLWRAP